MPGDTGISPSMDEIDLDNPPFPLTAFDRKMLSTRDEDFPRITWTDVQQILASNDLQRLQRLPSDLGRYMLWSHQIKQSHDGVASYVVRERLRWTPEKDDDEASSQPCLSTHDAPPRFAHHSTTPFADPRDFAVLVNDWPYGFADGIQHLLVWTKTPIAVDGVRGEVTDESRRGIHEFVQSYFVEPLGAGGEDRVLWFKNWVALQSVRGVDHVHVLVRDAPPDLVEKWTVRRDL